MRVFFLIFAWVPMTFAFAFNGQPGWHVFMFNSLLLLGFAVDICCSLWAMAIIKSRHAISLEYNERFNQAMMNLDFDAARECIRSEELFINRGLNER